MAESAASRAAFDGSGVARVNGRRAGLPAARALLAIATALLMLALAPVVASASEPATNGGLASPAIVGGGGISITLAPWQVEVEEVIPVAGGQPMVYICGGSILSTTKVLTAAHCVFNESKQVSAADILVTAGTSDFENPKPEPEAEQVKVSEVRVHPDYAPNPDATEDIPDDVAVLNLERPLVEGLSIRPIELAPVGSSLPEGTAVSVAGFGEENPLTGELNGTLNSIAMKLVSSHECGSEAAALFLCARTATGSVCFGDSGSGLTIPGSPAMPGAPTAVPVRLVGVTDTVEDRCADDALAGFANVTAPEIRDFIDGEVPQVQSVTPSSGPAAGGTPVKIKGKAFLAGATVRIGAAAVEAKFVSSTELTAKTPAGSGSPNVVVSDLGGTSKGGPTFTYIAPPALESPTVESITPNSGPAAGGTSVKIKGKSFLAGATVTIGAAAAEVKFVSSSELTAKTPVGSGSRSVVVSDLGGTSKGGIAFTYIAPSGLELPTVESVTPNAGPAAGGTVVKIKGKAFLAGAVVTIGASAAEVKFVSSTELTAKTPAGSGSPEAVVSDLGGTSKGGPKFTYEAASTSPQPTPSPSPAPKEVVVGIAPVLGAGTPLAPVGGTTPPRIEGAAGVPSNAALLGAMIAVQSGSRASVKVACRGTATCRGELTLTTKSTVEFKGKPTLRTVPIGSAGFSVLGGGSKTVKIKLGSVGRALLISGHGRLSARLSIVKVEPAPRESQVKVVQLVARRVHSSTR